MSGFAAHPLTESHRRVLGNPSPGTMRRIDQWQGVLAGVLGVDESVTDGWPVTRSERPSWRRMGQNRAVVHHESMSISVASLTCYRDVRSVYSDLLVPFIFNAFAQPC